jgi:hypothetical protein
VTRLAAGRSPYTCSARSKRRPAAAAVNAAHAAGSGSWPAGRVGGRRRPPGKRQQHSDGRPALPPHPLDPPRRSAGPGDQGDPGGAGPAATRSRRRAGKSEQSRSPRPSREAHGARPGPHGRVAAGRSACGILPRRGPSRQVCCTDGSCPNAASRSMRAGGPRGTPGPRAAGCAACSSRLTSTALRAVRPDRRHAEPHRHADPLPGRAGARADGGHLAAGRPSRPGGRWPLRRRPPHRAARAAAAPAVGAGRAARRPSAGPPGRSTSCTPTRARTSPPCRWPGSPRAGTAARWW